MGFHARCILFYGVKLSYSQASSMFRRAQGQICTDTLPSLPESLVALVVGYMWHWDDEDDDDDDEYRTRSDGIRDLQTYISARYSPWRFSWADPMGDSCWEDRVFYVC